MVDSRRKGKNKKNSELETFLKEFSEEISQIEALSNPEKSNFPLVFILGAPRSGTTILFQLLAKTNLFFYPTNFISRFYANPVLGVKIQQLLLKETLQVGEEFSDIKVLHDFDFSSEIGKTKGIFSPNEFWYFWRRFFNVEGINIIDDTLKSKKINQLLFELSKIFDLEKKTLLFKGLMFNEHLKLIKRIIPNAKFIHIVRNTHDNAISLLKTREKFFGDKNEWYSFRTSNFEDISKFEAELQVVAQIKTINKKITSFSKEYPTDYLRIDYEELCDNPEKQINLLLDLCGLENLSQPFAQSSLRIKKYTPQDNILNALETEFLQNL